MRYVLILFVLASCSLYSQSVGARWGIFKPHPDLRSQSSPGSIIGAYFTIFEAAGVPLEIGANYWAARHSISSAEGYLSLSYRVFSLKHLDISPSAGASIGRFDNLSVLVIDGKPSRGYNTIFAGLKFYHYGATMDVRFRSGSLDGSRYFRVGGWDVSFGYVLQIF